MESKKISIIFICMNEERSSALEEILTGTDYYAFEVFSKEELLANDRLSYTDCLIVDYGVWNEAGFEIECIIPGDFNKTVPVIFTGDRNDESIILESFKKGSCDYIPYPFIPCEVLARINNQVFLNRSKKILENEAELKTSDLTKANVLLNESIKEYKMVLKNLQENETLLLTIALNIPNSYLAIIEKNFTIGFAVGQEFKKSNVDPWRLIGLPIERVFKEQYEFVKNHFIKTFNGNEISFEMELNNQFLLYKAVPLYNSAGEVPRILVVAENISEQRKSENKIKESLMEKETLLKEIHHRVKNNMQLVCSMMNLQADSINNSELSDIFKVLQSRIYSMSLVHEKLYHHNQFSKINFSEYVKELVSEISKSFLNENYADRISIDLVLQDENFTIEKAIPCGLILNELILNAFKHASLISRHGYIKIVFEKIENGCYKLAVIDNGKGLPDGFDISRTETMGMLLVRELVSQLKGSISVESGSETTFTIVFGDTQDNNNSYNPAEFGSGLKNILLVEDERIISRMLRKIIEDHGYNIVDVVSSGQDAINSAARYTPDLIIMDIMLEDEIDGVQAAIEINKNNPCPIIFLTGNSDPATLRSARDINPYEMLTKPVEKYQLIDVIESAFKCISH